MIASLKSTSVKLACCREHSSILGSLKYAPVKLTSQREVCPRLASLKSASLKLVKRKTLRDNHKGGQIRARSLDCKHQKTSTSTGSKLCRENTFTGRNQDARESQKLMLRAVGFGDGDFTKPIVGIANGYSTITPCNMGINDLANRAVAGARAAGAMPQMFGTITISDGISMGTEGMKYSLVSREVIADSQWPEHGRRAGDQRLRQEYARSDDCKSGGGRCGGENHRHQKSPNYGSGAGV